MRKMATAWYIVILLARRSACSDPPPEYDGSSVAMILEGVFRIGYPFIYGNSLTNPRLFCTFPADGEAESVG